MSTDKHKSWKWQQIAYLSGIMSCLQFFGLTIIAMFFYPAGTFIDPKTEGYSFFSNFFSDLGMTVTHAGQHNAVSFTLFFLSLCIMGVSLVFFFVAWPSLFWKQRAARALSIGGSIVGGCTGLALLGIALTPVDLYLQIHLKLVYLAFPSFLLTSILYCVAIFINRQYPNAYAIVFAGFVVVLFLYVGLLFFGPGIKTDHGLMIQASGQKIVVYSLILCVAIQSFGAWRLGKQNTATSIS